ncbi:MAG TPA: hypothetical protein VE978_21855 [Chitinophagales bacterium]|nr:hypothetical protein [Chitinophagales bacterium]
MKNVLFVCIFILAIIVSSRVEGQNLPKNFCDTASYRLAMRLKGDMVKVMCDTVYFMNEKTFHLLFGSYGEYHRQTEDLSGVFNLTDAYLEIYKKRVEEQRKEYDSLIHYFDSLSASSNRIVEHTQSQLLSVSSNLDSIEHDLNIARGNIGEAKNIIKVQQRKQWITKILWGAGGVAVGVWIATLILK